MLTLHEDPELITANLLAPLIFSRRSHMARQVILQNSDYELRFSLFGEVADEASAEDADATEAVVEQEMVLRASA